MSRIQVILLVAAGALSVGSAAAGQASRNISEQTSFSAEDSGVQHPVTIPTAVMALLGKEGEVRDTAEFERIPISRVPANWFSASAIRLGPNGTSDLIVAAEGPLVGGNVEAFWVVIRTGASYRIALRIHAHDLAVQRRRSHGYRNIQASGETCCTITSAEFQFDGTVYRRAWSKTENIQ